MILGAILGETPPNVLEAVCVVLELGAPLTLSDAEVNVVQLNICETTDGLWIVFVVYELVESIDSAEDESGIAVAKEESVASPVDDVEKAEVFVRVSEVEGNIDRLGVPVPDIADRVGSELEKEGTLELEGKDELASPTTVITRHLALHVASSVWFCVL